jgi:hypothetical protein
MPELGDVVRPIDLGFGQGYHKAVWHACLDCGKERWVTLRGGEPQSKRCHPCGAKHAGRMKQGTKMGPRASNWRGGRQILRNGYVMITLAPDDPYVAMGSAKRHRAVYEHRYVMARHLGRCLATVEQVHHRNGDKTDNRLENLELISASDHSARHHKEIKALRKRVKELEAEVATLKAVAHEHQTEAP